MMYLLRITTPSLLVIIQEELLHYYQIHLKPTLQLENQEQKEVNPITMTIISLLDLSYIYPLQKNNMHKSCPYNSSWIQPNGQIPKYKKGRRNRRRKK